jgi:hypothetical protein
MTSKQAVLLDEIFQAGEPREVVSAGFVERRDMQGLRPGMKINDNVIDGWIQVFNEHLKRRHLHGAHRPRSGVLNSKFYEALAMFGQYEYERVRRWTLKFGDVFEMDKLFVPLCLNNRWIFVMLDFQTRNISYYNAYDQGYDAVVVDGRLITRETVLCNLRRWVCDECMCKKGVGMSSTSWTIQPNPTDLPKLDKSDTTNDATFVLKSIQQLANGKPISVTDALLPHLRAKIAIELYTGCITDEGLQRRARLFAFYFAMKLLVLAKRAREKAWHPNSEHVATLAETWTKRVA